MLPVKTIKALTFKKKPFLFVVLKPKTFLIPIYFFISVARVEILTLSKVIPLLFKIDLAFLIPLTFHINLKIIYSYKKILTLIL